MRQRFTWLASAANARWPEDAQVEGGVSLRPFNWVLIDNRGVNDVILSLGNPSASDRDYLRKVKAGKCRIFNVAGPVQHAPQLATDEPPEALPHELHLQALTGVTTVLIEVDDSPIVDMLWTI